MSQVAGWVEKNLRVLHSMWRECLDISSGHDILNGEIASFQSFCVLISRLSRINRARPNKCLCELTKGSTKREFGRYEVDYLDEEAESALRSDDEFKIC